MGVVWGCACLDTSIPHVGLPLSATWDGTLDNDQILLQLLIIKMFKKLYCFSFFLISI